MNIETGEIKEADSEFLIKQFEEDDRYVPLTANELTPKQKQQMWVSPKDNRSTLGKRRVVAAKSLRKKRKLQRQRRKANR